MSEILEQEPQIVTPKTKSAKEVTDLQQMETAIRIEHPRVEGTTRFDVKHLWDNYFRVNYWGEKINTSKDADERLFMKDNLIIASKFIRVEKIPDGGFKCVVLDQD